MEASKTVWLHLRYVFRYGGGAEEAQQEVRAVAGRGGRRLQGVRQWRGVFQGREVPGDQTLIKLPSCVGQAASRYSGFGTMYFFHGFHRDYLPVYLKLTKKIDTHNVE